MHALHYLDTCVTSVRVSLEFTVFILCDDEFVSLCMHVEFCTSIALLLCFRSSLMLLVITLTVQAFSVIYHQQIESAKYSSIPRLCELLHNSSSLSDKLGHRDGFVHLEMNNNQETYIC